MVVVYKKKGTCTIIDFAVPGERKDRKVSISKKRNTEDLECESENYAISCGLFT